QTFYSYHISFTKKHPLFVLNVNTMIIEVSYGAFFVFSNALWTSPIYNLVDIVDKPVESQLINILVGDKKCIACFDPIIAIENVTFP
ncbi:hypothetical protein, partial [Bacillus canaveralius]|uniref:hypothetical protein n=1 Tax=Bacillus canaveralius TaxID=1403243 RepID=UPI001C60DE94